MAKKFIYYFSEGSDAFAGDKVTMKNTLGGKGAGLAEMTAAGMPVPQGFTITTEACTQYYDRRPPHQRRDPWPRSSQHVARVWRRSPARRSATSTIPCWSPCAPAPAQSMPGMMDTILNLGLNDEAVEGLAKKTGNERFAYDSYRRFVQMFSDVVMERVQEACFEEHHRQDEGGQGRQARRGADRRGPEGTGRASSRRSTRTTMGKDFPQDPKEQLIEAVKAVFRSWDNPRANVYRQHERDPLRLGHRRQRPADGLRQLRRQERHRRGLHPQPRHRREGHLSASTSSTPRARTWSPACVPPLRSQKLHEEMPEVYDAVRADRHPSGEPIIKDMQDMEFTIENGKLYMLQTRNGKRTAAGRAEDRHATWWTRA